MRLECVKARGKLKQNADGLKWEYLPPVPERLFSGSEVQAEFALRNYELTNNYLTQMNAKIGQLIGRYADQERHYRQETARLEAQCRRPRKRDFLRWLKWWAMRIVE